MQAPLLFPFLGIKFSDFIGTISKTVVVRKFMEHSYR
jgi:hypothetical protein